MIFFLKQSWSAPNPTFDCRSFFRAVAPEAPTSYLNLHFWSPSDPDIWERQFGPKYSVKKMLSVSQTNVFICKFHI